LCRDVPRLLRTGRRHRKRRRRADARRPGVLTGMINISQRPAEAGNRPAIGTLAGQASRFTVLLHVPGPRYTAEAVADSLVAALAQLPAQLRRSLAWDQGSEMAQHAGITRALGMPVFVWQDHGPAAQQ
jgi:transposase, IS30 family